MMGIQRKDEITDILKKSRSISVVDLAKRLFVSEATIRRDLNEMEKQGFVKRFYGGVALIEGVSNELPLYVREQLNSDAKDTIARKASAAIQNGQVIFLDASSTVRHIIKYLSKYENLTIITNGIKTADELCTLDARVYCTGGILLHYSSAFVGSYAERMFANFNADLVFFSSRGVSRDGRITDASDEETQVRKAMFEHSKKKIFLFDSSKIGQEFCYNLCYLKDIDQAFCENDDIPLYMKQSSLSI